MKRFISHVRPLFNIQLVHLFSNAFESARYNMIIRVIVFLVRLIQYVEAPSDLHLSRYFQNMLSFFCEKSFQCSNTFNSISIYIQRYWVSY